MIVLKMLWQPLNILKRTILLNTTGAYFIFDKTFPPKERVEGTASQERFLELVASKREQKV